jgi:RNA polymerase sigma-70 factor (ECF subfamily)
MIVSKHLDHAVGCTQEDLIAMLPQMRAFARSLCRNRAQADDLTQEAVISAWRRRESYTPGSNLKAWLFTILRNRFYSDARRSWRILPLDPKVAEQTLVAVTNPLAGLELDDVRRGMLALPPIQREALSLVAVAGLSYQEAALICGCPEGTIKSRVCRARRRLTAILARGGMAAAKRPAGRAMASLVADAQRYQLQAAA